MATILDSVICGHVTSWLNIFPGLQSFGRAAKAQHNLQRRVLCVHAPPCSLPTPWPVYAGRYLRPSALMPLLPCLPGNLFRGFLTLFCPTQPGVKGTTSGSPSFQGVSSPRHLYSRVVLDCYRPLSLSSHSLRAGQGHAKQFCTPVPCTRLDDGWRSGVPREL